MKRSTVVAALATALLLAACTIVPGGQPTTEPSNLQPGLPGRTFISTGVTDNGVARPLVAGTQVRLDFRPDGSLGASAGCNSMGGAYRLDGATLRVENGGMTAMGCDPERHEQDEWLAAFLAAAPTVQLAGNDLALSADGVVIQLLDDEVANPDLPLAGTLWVVDGIRTRDAVSSVPGGIRATFRIGEDGSVEIETGCNEGSGQVSVEGATLRFAEVVVTERACPNGGSELERAIFAMLNAGQIGWSIDADRLTLDAGAVGLDLRAA